jgi:phenylalanine-4-hydroxylase
MRQSRAFFKDHAVPIYLDGLSRTGITLDRIPRIEEMDQKLKVFGWGAVPVCGFIPPAAFLDFQARKILPIASDMRTPEHIAYTPAPDIVHEAAGHAPIIADPNYADYLTRYAAMAQKAIFSQEDLDLYEAIRTLSDVKENPDSSKAQIAAAEAALSRATGAVKTASEANKVARMNWWTVEYGLLGSLAKPKIYGAGLLSSVGESQACLTDKVKKIRLTAACVETSYDITEPQPQLFVADDIAHLKSVLAEFDATLAYRRGGVYGLAQAKGGRTVTTTELDSGLQMSGRLVDYLARPDGTVEFVRFTGPVQLAAHGTELEGQGVTQHATGFSTPLGRYVGREDKAAATLADADLASLGLKRDTRAVLTLTTGFKIEGRLVDWTRLGGKLVVMKWRDCRVTRGSDTYFQPDWGDFDMGVGEAVTSVAGGPADRERYGSHDVGQASTTPGRTSPFTAEEKAAFTAYAEARRLRDDLRGGRAGASAGAHQGQIKKFIDDTARRFPKEWLLRLEALELGHAAGIDHATTDAGQAALVHDAAAATLGGDVGWLVRQGAALAAVPD